MFFPKDISENDQKTQAANATKFLEKLQADVPSLRAAASGWSLEDNIAYKKDTVSHAPENAQDQDAKVFLAVLGWDSVEAHKEATQLQVFKDNAHYLLDQGSCLGLSVYHISGQQVDAGGIGPDERGEIGGGAADAQEEVLNPQGGGVPKPKSRSDGTTTKNYIPKGNPTSGPDSGKGGPSAPS